MGEIGKRKGERGPGGRNGIDDINESIWSGFGIYSHEH